MADKATQALRRRRPVPTGNTLQTLTCDNPAYTRIVEKAPKYLMPHILGASLFPQKLNASLLRLAGFLGQLSPAGVEGVILVLGGVEFGEGLLQCYGVRGNLRQFDVVTGGGQTLVGDLHALLDGG